ncbi:gamma-glutamylcyclotransferase family protein [Phormidesmis priestleyi]
MSMIRVFTYGTLQPQEILKPDANLYQRSCAQKLVESCEAIAFGNLYHLPLGYPAMTIGTAPIYGFLLSFTDASILQVMDEYERHDPDDLKQFFPDQTLEDPEYGRQEIEVVDRHQRALGVAWAYIMTMQQIDRLQGILVPSGKWSNPKK